MNASFLAKLILPQLTVGLKNADSVYDLKAAGDFGTRQNIIAAALLLNAIASVRTVAILIIHQQLT